MTMDSANGGLSPQEKQRKAAEELARQKVLSVYEKSEEKSAEAFIKKRDSLGASATPALRQVSNEEWKKYHTAWQEYYQKYYSEYYLNAAKAYVAREQVKNIRAQAEAAPKPAEPAPVQPSLASGMITSRPSAEERASQAKSLKERIRARASEAAEKRAQASRRRRLLTPIFMGVAAMLVVLFLQYNRLIFARVAAYVSPGDSPASEISPVDPTVTLTKVSGENKLIIPKLNVEVPVHFGVSLDDVMAMMNHGVVHYRINGASAYPGEIGNFVITGHSAGDIYSSNQYKFIFSGLERLEPGDIMYIHYNGVRYTYKMTKNEIIEPTEVSKLIYETDKPVMTLITCWPLGTSRYRLLVTAEQISPSYADAVIADDMDVEETPETTDLPENEATFFERLKAWLGL